MSTRPKLLSFSAIVALLAICGCSTSSSSTSDSKSQTIEGSRVGKWGSAIQENLDYGGGQNSNAGSIGAQSDQPTEITANVAWTVDSGGKLMPSGPITVRIPQSTVKATSETSRNDRQTMRNVIVDDDGEARQVIDRRASTQQSGATAEVRIIDNKNGSQSPDLVVPSSEVFIDRDAAAKRALELGSDRAIVVPVRIQSAASVKNGYMVVQRVDTPIKVEQHVSRSDNHGTINQNVYITSNPDPQLQALLGQFDSLDALVITSLNKSVPLAAKEKVTQTLEQINSRARDVARAYPNEMHQWIAKVCLAATFAGMSRFEEAAPLLSWKDYQRFNATMDSYPGMRLCYLRVAGIVNTRLGHFEEAAHAFSNLAVLLHFDLGTRLWLGVDYCQCLIELKRYDDAIAVTSDALDASRDPRIQNDAWLRCLEKSLQLNMSAAFLHLGKWADAERHARSALAMCPDCAEAMTNLAAALLGLDRDEEGVTLLDQAIKIDPHLVPAVSKRLAIGIEAGQTSIVAGLAEQIAQDPEVPDVLLYDAGTACAELQDFELAKRLFYLRLDRGEDARTLVNLGNIIYLHEHDKVVGRQLYRRAIAAGPTVAQSFLRLAELEDESGDPQEALSLCIAGLAEFPDDVNLAGYAADLEFVTRDWDHAVAHYDQYLERNPRHFGAQVRSGCAHWAAGNTEEGQRRIRAGVATADDARSPEDRWLRISDIAREVRLWDQALWAADQANLEAAPSAWVEISKAQTFSEMGQKAKSIESYMIAVRMQRRAAEAGSPVQSRDLARMLHDLGAEMRDSDSESDARECFAEAAKLLRSVQNALPGAEVKPYSEIVAKSLASLSD